MSLPKNNGDKIILGDHEFSTLVAVSSNEQAVGLMFQKWPPPVMTFPFEKTSIHKFWMKNTPSPLDIVFIRNNKIVAIEHGEPLTTYAVGPNIAVDLVVELPSGTCESKGICVGHSARRKFSLETLARSISGTLVA